MARPAQEIPDRSGAAALDNPFLLGEPAPVVERWGRALAGAVTVAGAALVLTGTAAADTEDGPGGAGRETPTSASSSGTPTSTDEADTGAPPLLLDAVPADQGISTPPTATPTGASDILPADGTTTAGDGPDPRPGAS